MFLPMLFVAKCSPFRPRLQWKPLPAQVQVIKHDRCQSKATRRKTWFRWGPVDSLRCQFLLLSHRHPCQPLAHCTVMCELLREHP